MQDQLTGNSGGNLQQQQGNLQQNSPNLQQGGTPTTTLNSSNILSEAPPAGELRVTTNTTTGPSTIQPDNVAPQSGSGIWLLLLIIPVAIVAVILLPRKTEVLNEETEQLPPAIPQNSRKKSKKKSQKRKKSGRR